MQGISTFTQMVEHLKVTGKRKRIAIVCPYDDATIDAAIRVLTDGIAELILVGDSRLSTSLPRALTSSPLVQVVITNNTDEIAPTAVKLIRNGEADVLMKGLINTDNFLHAILNKECGLLHQGQLLTHLSVAQLPGYSKLLFFSDVAVIPYPTLQQRVDTIKYDVTTCRKLGIAKPKVALIHFTEKVSPKFQNSVDYTQLIEMGQTGEFGNIDIAGPMDVKTACDAHSADVKGITSSVCGHADLLIFPNIESGNTFYKTITLFGQATIAGILQGTMCPVILASRSDSADSKYYSIALACINAI